uniref:N-alpha-acetyltransferase 40 n=1 Tax=Meloidogyne enterolobii TaxID=390850 RepID=A0A6V7XMX5_MELEN|nr:unnamed protein product [Meloidogyne enterolobii]CAD2195090.1 unnamed protein product [Meloidogyne enterolobii]CAD2200669.1 unnamed protein product [Meloidogyne enterolobii]
MENAKKMVRKAAKLQQHQIMKILQPTLDERLKNIGPTCSSAADIGEGALDGFPDAYLLQLHPEDPPYLFECFWATRLNRDDADWAFQLFRRNMLELYKRSRWGFDEELKQRELTATAARFFIIRARIHHSPSCPCSSSSDTSTTVRPVAYAHFRFVEDDSRPVLYCYELQVEKDYHRRGLGTFLTEIMEIIGKSTNMDVVMCTVFSYNESSIDFFRKNGYDNDRTCIYGKDRSGGCLGRDYLVLSKSLNIEKKEKDGKKS